MIAVASGARDRRTESVVVKRALRGSVRRTGLAAGDRLGKAIAVAAANDEF